MTLHTFLLVLAVGAALLALWLVVRFPGMNPEGSREIAAALAGAVLVVFTVPVAITAVGGTLGSQGAIFLVTLPGLVYLFLVVAWVMLFFRKALAPYLRR